MIMIGDDGDDNNLLGSKIKKSYVLERISIEYDPV